MYRTWLAIGVAGLLGGVAVVALFAGFGSPVFLGVAAVGAAGAFLAYRYARERMLRSVYAGVETDPGAAADPADDGQSAGRAGGGSVGERADDVTPGDGPGDPGGPRDAGTGETGGSGGAADPAGRSRGTQATDGGEATADYDDWTWADSDPDDPFWSDDPGDWEDPWEWEATDPEEAAAGDRRWRTSDGAGSTRWSGWSGGGADGTAGERDDGDRHGGPTREDGADRPTPAEAYETLGLEPGADLESVRRAFRERAKETHPDRGGDPEAFIRVREAYERLRERLDDGE